MRNLKTYLAAIAAVSVLSMSGPALAHARLMRSNPGKNAVVASPKAITLTFDDKLVAAFSTFTVTMPMSGQSMNVPVKTHLDKGGKTLTGTPSGKLGPGSYVVHWTAAAAEDGHKMSGEYSFKVK